MKLETGADSAGHIYLQAGLSHAMPPGNVTSVSEDDRAAIRDWFAAATGG